MFIALLTQGVHLINGIVLVFLISYRLSLEAQGFYYTFGSLIAIQLILDLDFQLVILVIASHEWSKLGLNERGGVCGDPDAVSRLAHQTAIVVRWYCCAGVIATILVGAAGYWLMSRQPHPSINWQNPWLALVILNGFIFWMRALSTVVEGCNEVLAVNKMRLYESVLRAAALWSDPYARRRALGACRGRSRIGDLDIVFPSGKLQAIFQIIERPASKSPDRLEKGTWPIQWRMGLSGLLMYFAGNCFNPVMFYYHGAAIAGTSAYGRTHRPA